MIFMQKASNPFFLRLYHQPLDPLEATFALYFSVPQIHSQDNFSPLRKAILPLKLSISLLMMKALWKYKFYKSPAAMKLLTC